MEAHTLMCFNISHTQQRQKQHDYNKFSYYQERFIIFQSSSDADNKIIISSLSNNNFNKNTIFVFPSPIIKRNYNSSTTKTTKKHSLLTRKNKENIIKTNNKTTRCKIQTF